MDRRTFLKTAIGSSLMIGAASRFSFPPSAAAEGPDEHFVVTADVLNGRTGPGLGSEVIVTYTAGERLGVVADRVEHADGYTWRLVNVKPGPVWVAQEFLEPGTDDDIPQDRVQVADGPLNVRSEPGLDSEVYITAPTGAYGTIMDPDSVETDGYTWVYVQLDANEVVGWMAMAFLSYIDVA